MLGHSSEKRWDDISSIVQNRASILLSEIQLGEEEYKDLLEVFTFAGGTDQLLADQLFFELWFERVSDPIGAPGVEDTQANAAEVAKVADLSATMLSVHQMFLAMTNTAVATKDRAADFRRMS